MSGQITARAELALVGALGGVLVWMLLRAVDQDWIADYPAVVLLGATLTLFGALLGMAGPIGLGRASLRAVGLAAVVGGLIALTMLRYASPEDFLDAEIPVLAAFVVAALPVPFLIAGARSNWRDYPALFLDAWSVALRYAAAGAFTGLVWLVIFLSDAVLNIVGIDAIGRLLEHDLVPLVLSGAVLGLGMAVIHDLADLLSPYVVLRLFRLFLPVVLAVMVVFLIALPFRGLDGLTGNLSPALLLLTMVAGGISLVSIAVDQSDAEATQSVVLRRSAQIMAVLLPLVAGLALWAIWLRVQDRGWSPDRVFVTLVGAVGVAYGLVYALAVLHGSGWMQRIRQGNTYMALLVILLAALWLTPILNAERISARDQLARFDAGTTPVEALDPDALRSWGKPGAAAIAELEARAEEPGQEALAARLAGEAPSTPADRERLLAGVKAAIPVQPTSATGTRDTLFDVATDATLQDWLGVCQAKVVPDQPGCLMVVGDLLPVMPGEEAVLFLPRGTDYVEVSGLYIGQDGQLWTRGTTRPDGSYVPAAEAFALMRQYHDAPPPVTAAQVNQLGTGEKGLIIVP
jgi:hypothetical protein